MNLNAPVKCGGTILQLAILRGNLKVISALLEAGADVKTPVSLEGFNIPNAPKEIPILHFAGFYAPRQDIIKLIIAAGADVTATDENGESLLWYMNQNPVLRNTDLSDEIRNSLLFAPQNINIDGARLNLPPINGEKKDDNDQPSMRNMMDPRVPPLMAPRQSTIAKTEKNTVRLPGASVGRPVLPLPKPIAAKGAQDADADTQSAEPEDNKNPSSQGAGVILSGSTFQPREIVEPDMPVKE